MVSGAEAFDTGDVPTSFVEVTVNTYVSPTVRPSMMQVSGPLLHVHVAPPGEAVAVWEVTGTVLSPRVQVTAA